MRCRCCRAAACSPIWSRRVQEADGIGYPVMLKSTAGGGGIGMQPCCRRGRSCAAPSTACDGWPAAISATAASSSKSSSRARATSKCRSSATAAGSVIALGERDCSMQRRNQKVIEETPAPGISDATAPRAVRGRRASRARGAVSLRRHGRVHRRCRRRSGATTFYFLEVNTRLQVEHGVTEAVTGIDLVEWMLRVAASEPPRLAAYRHAPQGVADPGAPLCRGSGARFPALQRLAVAVSTTDQICASTAGSNPVARCRPTTIRCWPRSIAHAPTRAAAIAAAATRRWPRSCNRRH